MRKFSICLLIAALAGWSAAALAANTGQITVTVTIQNLSVSTTGPIAFGTLVAGAETVSSSASTVTNDGNVPETYSLSVTNPGGWTAVQAAPEAEEYALLAMFNSVAPLAEDFSYADHALSTTPAACTAGKFAGDQTGVAVAAAGENSLWFRFNAPASTAVATEQSITITITAAAS